jgi:hypothetical protein
MHEFQDEISLSICLASALGALFSISQRGMVSVLMNNIADFHLCHSNYLNTISMLFLVYMDVILPDITEMMQGTYC